MAIVENQFERVTTGRLCIQQIHILFAGLQHFLSRTVTASDLDAQYSKFISEVP